MLNSMLQEDLPNQFLYWEESNIEYKYEESIYIFKKSVQHNKRSRGIRPIAEDINKWIGMQNWKPFLLFF